MIILSSKDSHLKSCLAATKISYLKKQWRTSSSSSENLVAKLINFCHYICNFSTRKKWHCADSEMRVARYSLIIFCSLSKDRKKNRYACKLKTILITEI